MQIPLEPLIKALWESVNVLAMFALAILSFTLDRWRVVPTVMTVLGTMVIAGFLGGLSAVAKATEFQGGWIQIAQLVQSIIIAALVWGAAAVLFGAGASVGLDKLGWWPKKDAPKT